MAAVLDTLAVFVFLVIFFGSDMDDPQPVGSATTTINASFQFLNNKIKQCNNMNKQYILTTTTMEKPPRSFAFKTDIPHLQTSDSCKQSPVPGCALPDLVWGG
jgi:hypothetical protein